MTTKLNLGCGKDIRSEYLNVDMNDGPSHSSFMKWDLSRLPWPWISDGISEIMMLDFLEHFPYRMTSSIIQEVWRVLTPGGKVVIQVPDAEECSRTIARAFPFLCNCCGEEFTGPEDVEECEASELGKCSGCRFPVETMVEDAIKRLYGGQDHPGNFHYNAFTKHSLQELLKKSGFKDVKFVEDRHQRLNWNMKIEAVKGDLW